MGENLEVVWAEFSTLKLGCFATLGRKCIVWHMQPLLKLKTRPKAHPVS